MTFNDTRLIIIITRSGYKTKNTKFAYLPILVFGKVKSDGCCKVSLIIYAHYEDIVESPDEVSGNKMKKLVVHSSSSKNYTIFTFFRVFNIEFVDLALHIRSCEKCFGKCAKPRGLS